MTSLLLLRLLLGLGIAGLLVFCLSYWWLGNIAHELAGTAMFLLLAVHIALNRWWYGTIPRALRKMRNALNVIATVLLAVAMVVLLVTSVLISNALAAFLSSLGVLRRARPTRWLRTVACPRRCPSWPAMADDDGRCQERPRY